MLEIIATKYDIQTEDKNIIYISNNICNSITAKYNYAINNYVLNSDETLICFHHDDCTFLMNKNKIEQIVLNQFKKNPNIGMIGIIGSTILYDDCIWWGNDENKRHNFLKYSSGFGSIYNKNDEKYNFREEESDNLIFCEGLCLFFNKKIFLKDNLRFDERFNDYHFYDLDISFQVLKLGYKIKNINIPVKHIGNSVKNIEYKKRFIDSKIKFQQKYADLKFPITINTFFRKKYSILMYNLNNYELFREPENIDPMCEYLYITDNPYIKSKYFTVIYENNEIQGAFEKCYNIRFNLFKYCNTDTCIYLDGSLKIKKSLNKLYTRFINSGCDIGLNIHPERCNLYDEYITWVKERDYNSDDAKKCLKYFKKHNYDLNYNGLYQGTLRICKNTELNEKIDKKTLSILYELRNKDDIERLDQTIYSYVINQFYKNIRIFPISSQVLYSNYIYKYIHNTNTPTFLCNTLMFDYGLVLNKIQKLYKL